MRPEDRISSYSDQVMYRSLAVDAYEGSDFQNLGFWEPGTQSLQQACEDLVQATCHFNTREDFLKAGFSTCVTLDTTEECRVSYFHFYMRFLKPQYRTRAITRRTYCSIMLYALTMVFGTLYYVCGWAQKD